MEERQAIAHLKQGDPGGLEVLVRKYQVQAARTVYLIVRNRALAEDIVQAAFLRAYERIAQFDPKRPFGPWFLRSVVNDAVKAVTRQERQISLESPTEGEDLTLADLLADPNPGPDALVETAEVRRAVWEALGQLPATQRAAIVLRYYLDFSEAEMTDKLDSPPGTIKWRLHAARERLRALLSPLWSSQAQPISKTDPEGLEGNE